MKNPYKTIHSTCEDLRKKVHVVLVRPEYSGNMGSVARAIENMGLTGSFRLVADKDKLEWGEARKMAKHAFSRLAEASFYPTLKEALVLPEGAKALSLASTARVGSANRPHPMQVRPAVEKAMTKLKLGEITDLFLVFGCESDGLANEEVDLCDWVVTIPSGSQYRSLNLAQAVLVFAHEVNENFIQEWPELEAADPSQRERLISHLLEVAEASGFILPEDPYKMRPRLESIFSKLPRHIPEAKTLHGLLDQVRRSVLKGEPDVKGRYRHRLLGSEGKEHYDH